MAKGKKKLKAVIKLQIPAGGANPGPPVGTALGPQGIPPMEFCNQFNNATKKQSGFVLPTVISVYEDRSFSFITKQPPAANLILHELGLKKGSAEPNKIKVGKLTQEQLKHVAELKMPDLNANDISMAMNIIAGTARNMGVEVDEA